MEVLTAETVEPLLLDLVSRKWSELVGQKLSKQDVVNMLHQVDIVHGRAKSDEPEHWVMEWFWSKVDEIGLKKLNHSPNPSRIAINLMKFREACWLNGFGDPPVATLKQWIHTSKRYSYVGSNVGVQSRIHGRNVRCMVFSIPGVHAGEALDEEQALLDKFWDELECILPEPNVNHSHKPYEVALNMPSIKKWWLNFDHTEQDYKDLLRLLEASTTRYSLVEKGKTLKSKWSKKTMRCWLFKPEPSFD